MIDDCRICMVFSQMFFPEFYDFVKRGNSFIDISGSVSSLHKFGTNPSQCGITNNLIRVQLVFLFCIDGLFDAFVCFKEIPGFYQHSGHICIGSADIFLAGNGFFFLRTVDTVSEILSGFIVLAAYLIVNAILIRKDIPFILWQISNGH